jgi:hypothetical protein
MRTTVSDDAFSALGEELGGAPPPESLAALSSDELNDLAAAVRHARKRQAAELAAAGDAAFAHVPRLLRGPIRKVLG